MKKVKKAVQLNDKWIFLGLLAFCLFVVTIWYIPGQLLAGGEESFSIFNDRNIFYLNGYWEEIGTGFSNPTNLGRIVPSLVVFLLRYIYFPLWLSQAFIFFIVLSTGITSMYFLSKEFIPKENRGDYIVYIICSLFYFINLYSMSQIWGRFLYSHMFAWAFLPLFLLLWIKWLGKGSFKILFLIIISSFIYSLAYMQPAFVITLWLPAFIWSAIKIVRKSGQRIRLATLSIIGFIVWSSTNIWWIYPYIILSKQTFTEKINPQSNIDSLRGVSMYFPTEQVLLLRQSFLFGELSPWYSFYSQPWILIISIVLTLVVGVGVITSRKLNYWYFLVLLLTLGWFVSKGTNPPFGNLVYEFLFLNIPIFGIFRNSYEKFGIVFLLPYSVFLVLGLRWLVNKISQNHVRYILLFLFCLCFIFISWPLITGDVFKSNRVTIPNNYYNINSTLNQFQDDGRILVFPLINGDGVDYRWGYTGVEPSEYFFDRQSLSKILRQPYFDTIYSQIYTKYVAGQPLDQELEKLNVKYLLLHHDVYEKKRNASSSAEVERYFKKNPKIKKITTSSNLSLYEYNGQNTGIISIHSKKLPKFSYKKNNHESYTIKIREAEQPYQLIFRNTYNPLWIARVNGETLKNHSVSNVFANSWEVTKKGEYEIEIVFKVWPWD